MMTSSRTFASLTCSLCTELTAVKFASIGDYIKHLRLFHAHRPDFKVVCGINGCIRSYSNLGSFKNHISFMHSTECEHRALEICADQVITTDDSQDTAPDEEPSEFGSESDSLTSDEDEDEDFISGHDISNLNEDENVSSIDVSSRGLRNNDNSTSDDIQSWTMKDLQKSSAHFLFGIKERYKLTQVAIQGIIQGTTSITQQCIAAVKSEVKMLMCLCSYVNTSYLFV